MSQNMKPDIAPSSQEQLGGPSINRSFIEMAPDPKRSWFVPLLYFLRFHWSLHLLSLVFSVIVAFLESLNVGLVLPLLSSLFNMTATGTEASRLVLWLNRAIDFFPIEDKVMAACTLLILVSLIKFVTSICEGYLAAYVGSKVLHEIKRDLLNKYCTFPYSFFLDHKQGDLQHVVVHASQRVSFSLWMLPLWIAEVLKIIAVIILLVVVNFRIALFVIAVGFLFHFIAGRIAERLSYRLGKLFAMREMEQTNLVDELLAGVKHVFVFGVFSHWLRRFNVSSEAQAGYQTKQRVLVGMPKSILELGGMTLIFGGVITLRLYSPDSFLQNVPLIGLIAMALVKSLPTLSMVSRTRLDLMNQLPYVEVVHRVLTMSLPEARHGDQSFSTLGRSIVFDNVSFAYPDREPILKGGNVTFMRNQVTAIVGRSGEGKTTVINLLLGLYEPTEGCIRVDGVDLKAYNIGTWRARMGFVSQDPFIFHGTVAENIAFGDDRFSRDQIVDAASIANADTFIEQLPEGYDTIVGERGMKLSGGQQQRIAIARALLRKPEILILDEATSALDNVSERLVQEAITRVSHDRTVILVAHRLSTVQNAEKIVVLDKGRFVEEGTHDQLMRRNGVYVHLNRAGTLKDSEDRVTASS